MTLIVVDAESFFDQDYSLKKMSTEEYVRDPQFKAHLIGLKFDDGPPVDVLPAMLETNAGLRAQIESSAVLAHHAHFDGLILEHHYGLRPKLWLDTLSMARLALPRLRSHSLDALATYFGLPNKSVPYNLFRGVRDLPPDIYRQVAEGCRRDVQLTWEVFQRLVEYVPRDEIRVIDQTVRMFTEPVLRLDRPRLQKFLGEEVERKEALMFRVGATLGVDDRLDDDQYLVAVESELQSSDKFAAALRAIGYECPTKWSPKQEKEIPALAKTDDGMKELLENEDSRVSALAAARLGVKSTIDETRAQRLLDADSRGRLPVYLAFAAAKTLRFGGGDKTNWQNFRRGGEIRGSVVAPEGHKLVIVDAAQVECRGVNWQAGQTDVLDLFREGRDVYCALASKLYGREITKADERERWLAKQVELGSGFGLGWKGLRRKLAKGEMGGIRMNLTEEEAQNATAVYRRTHPQVVAYWGQAKNILGVLARGEEAEWGPVSVADHLIYLPNGAYMDYEGLRWGYYDKQPGADEEAQWWLPTRKGDIKVWHGTIVENVTQALWSGLLIREAMVKIGSRHRIVLQVHDELIMAVPEVEAETAKDWAIEVLSTPPAWAPDVPLSADGVVSSNYSK